VPYRIEYDPAAEEHLSLLDAHDESTVLDTVAIQLGHEPTATTRNRKRLRPNRLAPWVLRIGRLRVYYEVKERPEKLVTVRAVGVKDRNRLRIGGEEIDLS
jgi:mRNA-degrading endonuclease RelE of RelBE toxin-antitoxin system